MRWSSFKRNSSKANSIEGKHSAVHGAAEVARLEKSYPKSGKTNDRFVRASEKEVNELQNESKAKRTHMSTKWGVKLLKGGFAS